MNPPDPRLPADPAEISGPIVEHYHRTRRPLPFREHRDPYAIWVSEIMAQQTRIATVIPYWERWMARFPSVTALARAPLDDVLAAWAGLGYYARARSLHKAARQVEDEHGGRMPDTALGLLELPGIGRYTAGAIASIAFGRRSPVVDGNIARVFARLFGLEDDVKATATLRTLWDLADQLVPADAPGDFNQGLMELGALVCTPRNPACTACPVAARCVARAQGRQDELPVVRKRGEVPEVVVDSAWITRGGRWLLMRRVPSGLFGGLWELPAIEALPPAARTAARKRRGAPVATHSHKLSHRTIRYQVHPVRLPARASLSPVAPYDAARFVAPEELADLAISSATAELARALLAR